MIILNDLFARNRINEIENNGNSNTVTISDSDKVELINRIMLDKRLSAGDMKVYIFLLSYSKLGYTQEEIAIALSVSRVNVSKSISRLIAFNYISIEKKLLGVSEYSIVPKLSSGISNVDIDSLVRLFNQDLKGEDKIDDIESQEILNEWNELKSNLIDKCKNISNETIEDILKSNNAKLILFVVNSGRASVKAFRERYLDSTINFYIWAGLLNDEFFFETYYTLLSQDTTAMKMLNGKYFSLGDVMACGNILHANDTRVLNKFKNDTKSKIEVLDDMCMKMRDDSKYEDLNLIDDLIYVYRRLNLSAKKYTLTEFLSLIYLHGFDDKFSSKTGMLFYKFVNIFDTDLAKEFGNMYRMKNEYNNRRFI